MPPPHGTRVWTSHGKVVAAENRLPLFYLTSACIWSSFCLRLVLFRPDPSKSRKITNSLPRFSLGGVSPRTSRIEWGSCSISQDTSPRRSRDSYATRANNVAYAADHEAPMVTWGNNLCRQFGFQTRPLCRQCVLRCLSTPFQVMYPLILSEIPIRGYSDH